MVLTRNKQYGDSLDLNPRGGVAARSSVVDMSTSKRSPPPMTLVSSSPSHEVVSPCTSSSVEREGKATLRPADSSLSSDCSCQIFQRR